MSKVFSAVFSCAAVLAAALLSSCTNANLAVMTVDGAEVYAYEYAYYLNYYKYSYEESYGSEIWDVKDGETGMADYVKQLAANQAIFRQTIIKAAEKENVTLTKEDIATLKNNKKEDIEAAGGAAAWQERLAQAGSSVRLYDGMAESSLLYNKLNDKFYGQNGTKVMNDDQFFEYFKNNYISAAHILIKTTDADGNELSAEQKEEKHKQAEQILAVTKISGKDFDELAEEYSEDTGLASNPHGYTFTEGTMVEQFYQGALSLSENEISDIIESSYGYHIIKRLPLNTEYYQTNKDDLKNSYYEKDFANYFDEQSKEMEIKYTDAYAKINISNLSMYM